MKPETIRVGDCAVCRSRYYRDQLQLPQGMGLVIEIKRSNFKILYPSEKRCWLPREALTRVAVPPGGQSMLDRLHFILRRVNAHECEIRSADGRHRIGARIDKIDHALVDELRSYLGDDFVSLEVVPEGMAFMQLELEWKSRPA